MTMMMCWLGHRLYAIEREREEMIKGGMDGQVDVKLLHRESIISCPFVQNHSKDK